MNAPGRPDPDGRDIGFEAAVGASFAGLAREYGLSLVGCDEYSAHYASECVWLVIRHDRMSYELSVDLARPGHDEEMKQPYSLQDAIRVTDLDLARGYRNFVADSPQGLVRGAQDLAERLRTYGEPALRCDAGFFAAMARGRAVAVEDFGRDSRRASEDAAARQAVATRDWRRVVEIYESRRDTLSPSEDKRLKIARRYLQGQ